MYKKQANRVISQIFDQMDGDSYVNHADVKIGKEIYPVDLFWRNNGRFEQHIARIVPDYEQGMRMTSRQWDMIDTINAYLEQVDFIF